MLNKKNIILIWGTGVIAKEVYDHGLNGKVIGFIETSRTKEIFQGHTVYEISTEGVPEYDYIIVANAHTDTIYEWVIDNGINVKKLIFICFCGKINPREHIEEIKNVLGYRNFQEYCIRYNLVELSFFAEDREAYSKLNDRDTFKIQEKYLWPVITDKYDMAGTVNNYFIQDLWAASLIYEEKPEIHYDIGSRLDGFIAHILAMGIPVTMIDIRPFPAEISGLTTIVDDATNLKQFVDNSIGSLSALCSLEHFGLGRYGDSIDPEACFRCFTSIQRKMKRGGNLYIAVPVGKERLEFNAHRVFYAQTIKDCFYEMELMEYSCAVAGRLEKNVALHRFDEDLHKGNYCYGLFHFCKR